jgi:putative nucleotidyltransferase with HDIG domain
MRSRGHKRRVKTLKLVGDVPKLLGKRIVAMLRLPTAILQPGMTLARPIIDERGRILLRPGVQLTPDYITILKRRGFPGAYINDGDTDDIVIEDLLSDQVRRSAQTRLAEVFDLVGHVSTQVEVASGDQVTAAIQDSVIVNALRNSEDRFRQVEEAVTRLLNEIMNASTLTGLSQIRGANDTLFSHSINVTATALMLGRQLKLNINDLKRLGAGCMLHDIGKVFWLSGQDPGSSPGQQAAPLQVLREHPRLGYELLRARNPDEVLTNHIALEHHERQDGRGYPRQLGGTNRIERSRTDRRNISLISEIATVADCYDLLSVKRPGRTALTPKQIASTMSRLTGTFLNQEIVQVFLTMLPALPVGLDVIVRTGLYASYRGVVVQVDPKQPDRPLIRLLFNSQGDRIVPIDLDLTQENSITVEAVVT